MNPTYVVTDCPQCDHALNEYGFALIGACASVGIEHDEDTVSVLARFIKTMHSEHPPQVQP